MTLETISLVALQPDHIDGAVRLSRAAKWPHRPEDWLMSLALSQGCAALSDDGAVVGTVVMTPFGSDAATINMVIVDAAMRGRGLGRRLMRAAIDLAGDRALRLIATSDGLPLYQSLGFEAVGEVVQYQGEAAPIAAPDTVAPARTVDMPAIVALDQAAFGANREGLLAYIANVGRYVVLERAGRIVGFAGVRAFGRGEVIGPVVAEDADDARDLIAYALSLRQGAFVRVDIPTKTGLGDWLAAHGLAPAGGGIAMRRASPPPGAPAAVLTFALASQAYG